MYELVKKYLKDNGISDFSLFSLADDGDGVFIKKWGYQIEKPSFTKTQCKISEKQNELVLRRKYYLTTTAAYYVPDFPQDVLDKRALARQEINEILAASTLVALNKFSTNFE